MGRLGARRRIAAILFGAALPLAATGAWAYTADQQQACTGDAMRLCGAFVPDVDRITVCMIQNKARLTPTCRAHFGPTPVARTKSVGSKWKRAKKQAQREAR
jgi:hypothetical protein